MRTLEVAEFATEMHEGQVRKYTGEPYIEHPIAVALLVERFLEARGYSEEVIEYATSVALLHDTVEDTTATFEMIAERFGREVSEGVWYLTKTPAFVGNRAYRKTLCAARLARAPEVIRIIKTCDMFHNNLSIEEFDPTFWRTFSAETTALLEAMGTEEIFEELESFL
jgi:(p)ppGpp synthase/HD superfamily hydrolase